MMNSQEVKEFMLKNTGVEVTIQNSDTKLTNKVVRRVLNIFNKWYMHIPEANYATFLNTLLNDLETLHCCAVSGNPASPCYVGKQANCTPKGRISINSYDNCRLNITSFKTATYSLGKFF